MGTTVTAAQLDPAMAQLHLLLSLMSQVVHFLRDALILLVVTLVVVLVKQRAALRREKEQVTTLLMQSGALGDDEEWTTGPDTGAAQ